MLWPLPGPIILDYLDDTLKNPDDVQQALGLATLGAVPRIKNGATRNGLLLGGSPQAVEAYNVLRTNLQFAAVGDRLGSLLVTSPSPHEGKSLIAANLSVALAQASQAGHPRSCRTATAATTQTLRSEQQRRH